MRVVWITGAAGGLGQALVAEFAAQGWWVAGTGHRTAGVLRAPQVWPSQVDVGDRVAVTEQAAQIMKRWGRIDVLVNNAGLTEDQLLGRLREQEWDQVLAVNLKGAFLCIQAVLKPMMQQGSGHIIQIGSYVGRHGAVGQTNYAAAKAGLLGLTATLAKEVGAHNIRVNVLLPGVLRTPMSEKLAPAQLGQLAAANALGRLNSVAEVARFAAFLATLENVSGQCFQLDSRATAWA